MAATTIKDGYQGGSDNQLKVNPDGSINVNTGGGGGSNVNLTEVGGAPIAEGQTTMANSLPVVIASDQSPIAISGSISGNVNSNIEGLNVFQTSQYTVGTSAVQITPTPLSGRSSVSIRVTTTDSSVAVFIGNSNAVTTSTGYPLYNNDTLQMDLTPSNVIYAISTVAGQTVFALEIA